MPKNFVAEFTEHADDAWITANGAQMVARAWTDPEYRARMLVDGTAAARELGFEFPEHHRNLVVLENTPTVHNVIVCTLCSCTAYTIIGAAPDWYKDLDYRARVVRESRTVLREMGSGFGIRRQILATWSCRCSRPRRLAGPCKSWQQLSRKTR